MQPNKCTIVFLSLIARICAAGIILKSAEPDAAFEIDKAAINVITSCYGNRGNAVGVGGLVSGYLVKTLSSQQIPVALVDIYAGATIKKRYTRRTNPYKLQVFVLTVSTDSEFVRIAIAMINSVWWNNMGSILILYRSSLGCRGTSQMLFYAWRANIVNAKIICFDRQFGTKILGYNPFTTQAPEPWKLWATFPSKKIKHPLAVLVRSYRESNEICKNLDIDKMKNLNGHPIVLKTYRQYKYENLGSKQHQKLFRRMLINIYTTFESVVNASMIRDVLIHDNATQVNTNTMLDISWEVYPVMMGRGAMISRPFIEMGMVAMTQHRGYKTQLQKILSVVDNSSNIGVCIVLAVTLLFFKFFVNQALMPAFLNIVRIVCNTGFTNLPDNTPPRFYLTSVLFFAVTMQAIYQSDLASLLTTEVPFRNVKTLQDLKDLVHTVYAPWAVKSFVAGSLLERRVVSVNDIANCTSYVLRDSSAACVSYDFEIMDRAQQFKLHLSERLHPYLVVFMVHYERAIEVRFDNILGRLFEADLLLSFHLRIIRKTLSDVIFDEELKINVSDVRKITLRDLSFAFVMLGFGLACASITFVFEIVIYRYCSRIRIRRIRVRPIR